MQGFIPSRHSSRPPLLLGLLFLVFVSAIAEAQDPFEDNTSLGIFADPEGTNPCLSVAQGDVGRFHVIATTAGRTADGFVGAEFRIEIPDAEGYLFSFEPSASVTISIGDPFDLSTDGTTVSSGINMAWGTCQTTIGTAGDRITLGSILVVNQSGGPTRMNILRRSPPTNPNQSYPLFNACDGPYYTASPMAACSSGPTGEVIAGVALLNDPTCDPNGSCLTSCAEPPRIRLVGRRSPDPACPGDTVTLEGLAINTGTVAETIAFFVDNEPDVVHADVAPGDTVRVARTVPLEICEAHGTTYRFGAVATTSSCAIPAGREVVIGTTCSSTVCEGDGEGCATGFIRSQSVMAGDEFSVTIHLGDGPDPARNVFGVSGRLHYSRPDLVQFVEFRCDDEDGNPLSLGDDVICFSSANPLVGTVEFSVSQKAGALGRFGKLQIGRAVFRIPEEVGGGFCTDIRLDDVRAVNPLGNDLCVEVSPYFGGRSQTCSTSPCRVWPGDANRDGTVDALDLQAMASHWAQQGPTRLDQRCSWIGADEHGYEVDCWNETAATWSDAQGDGRVGPEDVLCVGLHWGSAYDSPYAPLPLTAGDPAATTVAYELMLQAIDGMSDSDAGVRETKRALQDLLEASRVPTISSLLQNVPNPFNPDTRIPYALSVGGHVRIDVFDVSGRWVRTLANTSMPAGEHSTTWDGRRDSGDAVASGIYYYRARLGEATFSRKMVLTR